jgi:D-sedoheptulose 7-phosphate isomerase
VYDGLLSFSPQFLDETIDIVRRLDAPAIDRLAEALAAVRKGGGRLFIIGVGGSAGHASHASHPALKLTETKWESR